MDKQLIELLGRNKLTDELLRADLEVARPLRDRGIDLIAYADTESKVGAFVARPIQMKASSYQAFGIDKKYGKFRDLLLAYVWNLDSKSEPITFALTYDEALQIATAMGYTKTESWKRGTYTTTRPSARLRALLEPYGMTPERWWDRVVLGN